MQIVTLKIYVLHQANNACCAPEISDEDGISTLFTEILTHTNPDDTKITPDHYKNYIFSELLDPADDRNWDDPNDVQLKPNIEDTITRDTFLSDNYFLRIGRNLEGNLIWNNLINNYHQLDLNERITADNIKQFIFELNRDSSKLNNMFKTLNSLNLYQFRELINKQ